MENKSETKLCKYCKTEIPKSAKICANCGKKQGGKLKWVIIVVVVIFIFAMTSGGDEGEETKPQEAAEVSSETGNGSAAEENTKENTTEEVTENTAETEQTVESAETVDNEFQIGEVVELENLKITFVSADVYNTNNEFIQPAEGNVYYRMEFEVENIGEIDELITSYDFNCYADGYSAKETWIGEDELSATLSPGKKAKGALYYEVPADAGEITLEYETSFWTQNKIIFVVK